MKLAAEVSATETKVSEDEIKRAITSAAEHYFDDCRSRIPAFIDRHFHYPGALATNRVALGWDMLLAPVNLFWAPFYAASCLINCFFMKTIGRGRITSLIHRIPAGFTTRVQRHTSDLILRDLLKRGNLGRRQEAPLLEDYILKSLQQLYQRHSHSPLNNKQFERLIEPLIDQALSQYQVTRTASADIANSISCTVLGAFAFQKFTPGGIGVGLVIASILAKNLASRDFIFGQTLGNFYYTLFPPEPSVALSAAAIGGVMAVLSAFAALSGIFSDPIQAATGLHRRRLNNMIDHLQRDFINQSQNSFRPRDQFVARLLDTFDMLKSGIV